eukprot:469302-Hanusia_phi.AAC.1
MFLSAGSERPPASQVWKFCSVLVLRALFPSFPEKLLLLPSGYFVFLSIPPLLFPASHLLSQRPIKHHSRLLATSRPVEFSQQLLGLL